MNPVYLCHYKRSAFSRAHPIKTELDALRDIRSDTLLSQLIDSCVSTHQLNPLDIDDLTIGCALGVKEQWSFGGRYPILQSSIGDQCASRSIDQQCGSGIAALRSAMFSIGSGSADIALAAGYENMTRTPMGMSLFNDGTLTVPTDILKNYDMSVVLNMGLTAQALAEKGGLSREVMDAFAFASHQQAYAAQQSGFLAGEIQPVTLPNNESFQEDANIRADTQLEKLATLKPAFSEQGSITAGNSSPLTSGAALACLMSQSAVTANAVEPIAKIIACADRGTNPEMMGQGVIPAVEKLLAMTQLTVDDIDYWEINEAFAAVPLYAIAQLKINPNQVNIHGGALALGHPLGATGIRLVGTLARTLQVKKARYGIATACIGGGQGIAMLIENCQ